MNSRRSTVLISLILLFAAFGLFDSILIHLKEIDALTNPSAFDSCKIGAILDCSAVANSPYSKMFGVPVSLFGILFDQSMLILSITLLAGFKLKRWMWQVTTVIITLAFLFSIRLLIYSYFGIGFLCIYCLVSNISTTGIFIFWNALAYKQLKTGKST